MRRAGLTIIELLVVVVILSVLVSLVLPLYLKSVSDSEEYTCKTNMKSVASAVQARRARTATAYFSGVVDDAAVAPGGPLRDLNNALPRCPGDSEAEYTVQAVGNGFEVSCSNPAHPFRWKDGGFVP